MRPMLIRQVPAEFDLTNRRLHGVVVPFGEVAEVCDRGGMPYRERFVHGSFARTIQERGPKVKLLTCHDAAGRLPIGRANSFEEKYDGLHAEFVLAETRDAEEVLALVHAGALDSFSVGFSPIRQRVADDGVLERLEVALREVSVVSLPAYEGALIGGVRASVIPKRTVSAEDAAARLAFLMEPGRRLQFSGGPRHPRPNQGLRSSGRIIEGNHRE